MREPSTQTDNVSGAQGIAQRAKSPQQKALRRQQILAAAAHCFPERGFHRVHLSDIAAQIGITKAALYRYFASKEQLFLALYLEHLQALLDDAETLSVDAPEQAAGVCAQLLSQHPTFCHLNAILHTVLEQNLSASEARAFKLELLVLMQRFARLLQQWLLLSADQAIDLLLHLQQAMIGCWHLCHHSTAVQEALAEPPLTLLQRDFGTTLQQHLQWLFSGFKKAHV